MNEFFTGLQAQTKKNKFSKILWGVAVVAVCFVVGAGVGFAVGLGIGAATGLAQYLPQSVVRWSGRCWQR